MRHYFCYLLILVLVPFEKISGQFTHEGSLSGVPKSGLYLLPLDPLVKQHMSSDFHDVRIYDGSEKEVPYVLISEPSLKSKTDFVSYPILSQKHHDNYSEIIIQNRNKDGINNIAFNINNSDAHKYCSVAGSDDLKQWYSLSNLQELNLIYNNVYTNTYKSLYFPLSDYRYFRLMIEDWLAEPVKINSAGYFKNSVIAGRLSEVLFSVSYKEDAVQKTTTIQLSSLNSQKIDRIDLRIRSPRLYMRHATVYAKRVQKNNNSNDTTKEVLCEFDINAAKPLLFDLPRINEKRLFIEIANKDNPSLDIESVTCMQLATYLVCDLSAGNSYKLRCGNMSLKRPEYDLVNFVAATPQLLPEVKLDGFKHVAAAPEKKALAASVKPKQKMFYENSWFVWICLGLAAAIIFWFSRTLLREMNKEDE